MVLYQSGKKRSAGQLNGKTPGSFVIRPSEQTHATISIVKSDNSQWDTDIKKLADGKLRLEGSEVEHDNLADFVTHYSVRDKEKKIPVSLVGATTTKIHRLFIYEEFGFSIQGESEDKTFDTLIDLVDNYSKIPLTNLPLLLGQHIINIIIEKDDQETDPYKLKQYQTNKFKTLEDLVKHYKSNKNLTGGQSYLKNPEISV